MLSSIWGMCPPRAGGYATRGSGVRPSCSVGDRDLVDGAVDDPPGADRRLAGPWVGLVLAERDQDIERVRVLCRPDVGRRRHGWRANVRMRDRPEDLVGVVGFDGQA